MHSRENHVNHKVARIISIANKAYLSCKSCFHDYFERQFNESISLKLSRKQAREMTAPNFRSQLHELIDISVLYRLELSNDPPDVTNLLYSFDSPSLFADELDDVLDKLIYSAYPVELVKVYRDALSFHIDDDQIIDVLSARIECDKK